VKELKKHFEGIWYQAFEVKTVNVRIRSLRQISQKSELFERVTILMCLLLDTEKAKDKVKQETQKGLIRNERTSQPGQSGERDRAWNLKARRFDMVALRLALMIEGKSGLGMKKMIDVWGPHGYVDLPNFNPKVPVDTRYKIVPEDWKPSEPKARGRGGGGGGRREG
jgi:hypothetical protein